jgi:hypothetical protein
MALSPTTGERVFLVYDGTTRSSSKMMSLLG